MNRTNLQHAAKDEQEADEEESDSFSAPNATGQRATA
jgi:hypothetical protein